MTTPDGSNAGARKGPPPPHQKASGNGIPLAELWSQIVVTEQKAVVKEQKSGVMAPKPANSVLKPAPAPQAAAPVARPAVTAPQPPAKPAPQVSAAPVVKPVATTPPSLPVVTPAVQPPVAAPKPVTPVPAVAVEKKVVVTRPMPMAATQPAPAVTAPPPAAPAKPVATSQRQPAAALPPVMPVAMPVAVARPTSPAPVSATPPAKPAPAVAAPPASVQPATAVAAAPQPDAPPLKSKGQPTASAQPVKGAGKAPIAKKAEKPRVPRKPAAPALESAAPPPPAAAQAGVNAPDTAAPAEVSTPAPEQHAGPAAQQPSRPSRAPLYIAMVASECAPVAKVGGLGDVVFGLSRELDIRGNSVEIFLPKYDCLRYDQIYGLQMTYKDLWVPWFNGAIHCSVYFGFVHGRKCFFIEPHSGDNFFNRGVFYGQKDDVLRFAFFSRAALEFMLKSGKHPDVIHCHDWQTALVPVMLFEMYKYLGMGHSRVCYTLHNLQHQGVTGPQVLQATGLNRPEYFCHPDRLQDTANRSAINLMKGGIVYSNFVTTVSPHYAWEIMNTNQDYGLGRTLHTHSGKLGGILNGLDYETWNPEIDRHIPQVFGPATLDQKYADKQALRQRFWLRDVFKPIVCYVGRLDHQKGVPLITHAINYCLQHGAQFVLLGTSPDAKIAQHFWGLKQQYNDNPDCHIEIGFNEDLSHLIYAGADMIIVPSLFEPCGLTQLIGLKYGTVPIVRGVGGLADTVFDANYAPRPYAERNGYVFNDFNAAGIESALSRALGLWYNYPQHFRELMLNGMRTDYSWNHSGEHYLNVYDLIRDK